MTRLGAGVGLYRAQGVVLRAVRLGESDRIVSFYTQSHGRVRAVAKGARRVRSRFGGRLEVFTHVDLQLYRGRSDLDIVTQAEIIDRPRRLRTDYAAFCAGAAIADAVERTTPERERNVRIFVLLHAALRALEEGAADPPLVAYAFLAKLASASGLHPTLEFCVECGGKARAAFSYERGGAVCRACVRGTDPRASERVLDEWSMLLDADWVELCGRRLPPGARAVGGLVVGFVQWHTESRLRAYALLGRAGG